MGSRSARDSGSRRSVGAGWERSSTRRSPTADRARRASRIASRKTNGARPTTTNMVRWMVRNASRGISSARLSKRTAPITKASEKTLTSTLTGVGSGRPAAPRRVIMTTNPTRKSTDATTSWSRRRSAASSGASITANALPGSKPPSIRPTTFSAATAYVALTSSRSPRLRRAPVGKARKTCMNTANATRSNAVPIVKTRSELAAEMDDSRVTNPAAIISRPKRFSGLRYQANSPHRT